MEDKLLRYTLRVDRLLFRKFKYVAEFQCRSANKEIVQFIKKHVSDFENKHGKINLEED